MNIDTLIYARWVVPVEPENVVLENYAIAILKGRIIELLPGDDARIKYSAVKTHHLDQHVITPGLINTHTHSAMNLFRGLSDDLPLMKWLTEHIWPAEKEAVSPDFVRDGNRLAIAEMIRGGTTCFNDMYFYPEQTAHVADIAGIRAVIGMIMIDFETPYAKDHQEYFLKGEAVHDIYRSHPRITTTFAPHAPYTVSDDPLTKIGILAEELDIPITIHLHETAQEVEDAVTETGERPISRLERLGLLSPRLLAVHMTELNTHDVELVTRNGVNIVHCPESNLKLASGFCPVHELLQEGCRLTLGTDGAASNNDLDMFGEMRTAALLAKGVAHNAEALPAFEVLKMATINGARALGLDDEIGSIKSGKQADIIAIQMNSIETQPVYDPVSQLIYAAGRDQVSDVWVAGKQLLNEGSLTTMNEGEILQKILGWQAELKKFH